MLLIHGGACADGAGADGFSRCRRLVDLARAEFDAGGLESRVLDLGQLPTGWQDRCPGPAERPAADGALILLPAHEGHLSRVVRMLVDRGPGQACSAWHTPARSCRTYGLVVHGDRLRALQVRRALCERLDGSGLLDACEQARLEHFAGLDDLATAPAMPPDGEAALEDETRAAARALVHAMAEIRAGRLGTGCALLARACPG
ncbi:MAG TPA: hypothetical protein VFL86_04445 [Burkholderiaceae bacterium]|nr:hypothetical protein [Burkholderiaceae bacterium]